MSGPRAGGARFKGRHWVMFWLAGFLASAASVQWRQTRALAVARDLHQLDAARGALDVSKASLTGAIHQARSRGVLVPLAERQLGLRLPQDSEIVILQNPRPR